MSHRALIALLLGCAAATAACSSQVPPDPPDAGGGTGGAAPPPDAGPGPACSTVKATWLRVGCTQPPLETIGPSSSVFDEIATVTRWGTGFEGCYADQAGNSSLAPSAVHLLTVRTSAGTEQSFALLLEGVNPAVAVGSSVHVTYTFQGGGFAPSVSRFEMDGPQGELILYMGRGTAPEQMTPPRDLSLRLGQQLCSAHDCGPWGRFEVVASMPVDPGATGGTQTMSRTMAPGTSARIGPYLVALGESAQQTPGQVMCADWFVSETTLVVTP